MKRRKIINKKREKVKVAKKGGIFRAHPQKTDSIENEKKDDPQGKDKTWKLRDCTCEKRRKHIRNDRIEPRKEKIKLGMNIQG